MSQSKVAVMPVSEDEERYFLLSVLLAVCLFTPFIVE